jgi:carbon monoxide dehydrogenase subunit G
MRVEGTFRFPAPRERVYSLLLDPTALASCIPGCEQLEAAGEDRYEATLKLGVAAIRGTYNGNVQITDQEAPSQYRMAVDGKGGPGFVRGVATITLTEVDGETDVHVEGDGQLGGPMAGVAQRLLGGVANMLMKQFFECMQTKVASGSNRETLEVGEAQS